MKTVKTLDSKATAGLIHVQEDGSDCIEICNSEGFDISALTKSLEAQAKHGCLGAALQWLFLEETDSGTALMMHEARNNPDWVKSYSAVYWFIAGWSDCDFAHNQ